MTNLTTALLLGFDLETTAPNPEDARIVTWALVEHDGEASTTTGIVDPGIEIPEEAAAIHGVTTERAVAEGEQPADALLRIVEVLTRSWAAGVPVVGHNLSYDLTVLDRECARHLGYGFAPRGPVLDTLVLDKYVDQYRKGQRTLGATAQHYGIVLENAHAADADALASVLILRAIAEKCPDIGQADLGELWTLQRRAYRQDRIRFAEYRRRIGQPLDDVSTEWPLRVAS